jgi:hypothetical protein
MQKQLIYQLQHLTQDFADGGLIYLPDLKAGLSNIHRSLIDGGRLVAAVWIILVILLSAIRLR